MLQNKNQRYYEIHKIFLQEKKSFLNSHFKSFGNTINSGKKIKLFITKRICSSFLVIELLHRLIILSRQKKDNELLNILFENLGDELGYNKKGTFIELLSHKKWLNTFLESLELNKYIENDYETYKALLFGCDYYEMLGIFLYIEGIIPFEFNAIQKKITIFFPKISEYNRKYLDDHIKHDAIEHFPNLLICISHLDISNKNFQEIISGIKIMSKMKIGFYDEVL